MRKENQQIEHDLMLVANPETSAAIDFYNQLEVAQLLLKIEIGDSTFRMDRLQEYLARNY